LQTTRLAESFELLTGSVALTGPQIFLRKPHAIRLFCCENPQTSQTRKCRKRSSYGAGCLSWG